MNAIVKRCLAALLIFSVLSPALSLAQVQIQGPRNAPEVYSGVVYGPIDQSDTLWRIASRYKPDSEFSIYQTMLAIYELNPQAFENQNFNTMISGATLQLPSDRYIARMDEQRARAKAEADDLAFGRPNSVQESVDTETPSETNLKPEIPLVNQEDLSATQTELQNQLNRLNSQQSAQFDQVKQQVSASIDNVQALIQENQRVFERLDQVNADISELRNKVEGEVQEQIDQQLALQKELIELVKQAEQRQMERESESILSVLSTPLAIITLSSILTAGILVILGLLLLRRPKSKADKNTSDTPSDIVDDELVIGEMDDDFDSDADDLMAALDQEMDDDDILSSELEDGLDELGVDDDDFSAVDEMLVPDGDNKAKKQEAEKAKTKNTLDSVDDDLSFDTDAISLDDEDFGNEEINLSPSDDTDTKSSEAIVEDLTADMDLGEIDQTAEVSTDEEIEALQELASVPDDQEPPAQDLSEADDKPEQAETLEEQDSEVAPSNANKLAAGEAAAGVALDESVEINSESLKEIEDSINETTQEFEALSGEIQQELETPSDEVESDEVSESNADEEYAAADTSQAPPVDAEEPETQANELKSESEQVPESEPEPEPESEFEGNADVNDLADEILNELEEEQASDELDSLLDNIDETLDSESPSQTANTESAEQEPDIALDLDEAEQEPEDATNDLANELLSELEDTPVDGDDELDALLDEISAESSDTQADTDALLDDIPAIGDDPEAKEQNTPDNEAESEPEEQSVPLEETQSEDNQDGNSEDEETTSDDADEDVLADLPGLDDWLEDDEFDKNIQEIDQGTSNKDDVDILADIENSDFDDLLAEIDSDDLELDLDMSEVSKQDDSDNKSDPFKDAGLNLESLMQEQNVEKDKTDDDAFIDVDTLLEETETATPLDDSELAFNLDDSIGKNGNESATDSNETEAPVDTDQASNLDLAQAYIEMDDLEAAREVLNQVQSEGSEEQIIEATSLLKSIEGK